VQRDADLEHAFAVRGALDVELTQLARMASPMNLSASPPCSITAPATRSK
jgi:hypothetical protein